MCQEGPHEHSAAFLRCALLAAWHTIWHWDRKSSSIEEHKLVRFGCANDVDARLGPFYERTVGFRCTVRFEVQYVASTNALKWPLRAQNHTIWHQDCKSSSTRPKISPTLMFLGGNSKYRYHKSKLSGYRVPPAPEWKVKSLVCRKQHEIGVRPQVLMMSALISLPIT